MAVRAAPFRRVRFRINRQGREPYTAELAGLLIAEILFRTIWIDDGSLPIPARLSDSRERVTRAFVRGVLVGKSVQKIDRPCFVFVVIASLVRPVLLLDPKVLWEVAGCSAARLPHGAGRVAGLGGCGVAVMAVARRDGLNVNQSGVDGGK